MSLSDFLVQANGITGIVSIITLIVLAGVYIWSKIGKQSNDLLRGLVEDQGKKIDEQSAVISNLKVDVEKMQAQITELLEQNHSYRSLVLDALQKFMENNPEQAKKWMIEAGMLPKKK